MKNPGFLKDACSAFGGHIIVGLDAKDGKVATDGWSKLTGHEVVDLGKKFEDYGVESIIYTDIGRDGMLSGINIDATVKLAQALSIPVIASGGLSNLADIEQLCAVESEGVEGVICGRADLLGRPGLCRGAGARGRTGRRRLVRSRRFQRSIAGRGVLSTLAIANYRSLRQLLVPLGRPHHRDRPQWRAANPALPRDAAVGRDCQWRRDPFAGAQGGLSSTLWAGAESFSAAVLRGEVPVQGTRRIAPVNLRLGTLRGCRHDEFGYAVDIGASGAAPNSLRPRRKSSAKPSGAGPILRPATQLVDRKGGALRTHDEAGRWAAIGRPLPAFASMITEYVDPRGAPEMLTLREQMRSWRFYDQNRRTPDAPARWPAAAARSHAACWPTTALGSRLLRCRSVSGEIGDSGRSDRAVDDAFPGAQVESAHGRGRRLRNPHAPALASPRPDGG